MRVREFAFPRGAGLRAGTFVARCGLPLEIAAAVARGLGAAAGRALGAEVAADLFPPAAVGPEAGLELAGGGSCYLVRGERAPAWIAIDADDARRIAAHAFGEPEVGSGALSRLERAVVDDFAAGLAPAFEACCGPAWVVPALTPPEARNYFAVRIAPPGVAIGIGIGDAPAPAATPLAPGILDGCEIECVVRIEVGELAAGAFTSLRPGDVLDIVSQVGPSATLNVGADLVASGEAGLLGGRTAFRVCDAISGVL